MYDVVYLPAAEQQLTDAVVYTATQLNSPDSAEHLLEMVDSVAKSLMEMPYRYPIYPAFHAIKSEIRYVPIMNYLLFYTVSEENHTVEIWRFLHQRQSTLRP